jgi:hypothetical protein
MGASETDEVPTPGANGWDLVHINPEAYQTFSSLQATFGAETYLPETVEAAPWDDDAAPVTLGDFGVLHDAALKTPFDLTDPRYAQDMVISIGAGRDSVKWAPKTMPVATFVDMLSTHREDAKKDGLAFVLAEIVGSNRRKVAVKACYGVGLDIDVGVPAR